MTMPFRAIISDLDGTLLKTNHQIGDFTIRTFEKVANNGVDIFLATGRGYLDVSYLISKFAIQDAMLVTSNGAICHDLSGKLLLAHHIPEDLAFALMQVPFDSSEICLNSYQDGKWYINRDIHSLRKYHQDSGYDYSIVNFAQHHGNKTEKVFYIGKTAEALLDIEKYINQHFADKVQITYSTPTCLEIMAKDVCKANSLAELVKLRGYSLKECIAFGDGMNDVEMLGAVGKGCLMNNADPRLKEALPNNEVIGCNEDEAVAIYLKKIFNL